MNLIVQLSVLFHSIQRMSLRRYDQKLLLFTTICQIQSLTQLRRLLNSSKESFTNVPARGLRAIVDFWLPLMLSFQKLIRNCGGQAMIGYRGRMGAQDVWR